MVAMSTAAIEVPTGHDGASANRVGNDEPTPADATAARTGADGRVLATALLVLRPIVVFFAITATGYGLARAWPGSPAGSQRLGSYWGWLAGLVPLGRDLTQAVGATAELAVAGLLLGVILALVLSDLGRTRRLSRPVAGLALLLTSGAGPVTALVAYYWLIVRFDTGLQLGSISLLTNWGRGVDRLLAPAVVVGLGLAGPLASLQARFQSAANQHGNGEAGSSKGPRAAGPTSIWPAVAAPLASRAAPTSRLDAGPGLVVGFPAGLLAALLITAELLFQRQGVFTRLVQAVAEGQPRPALDALAALALAGAVLGLVVDLVGHRRQRRMRSSWSPERPSPRAVRVSLAALAVVAVIGIAGLVFAGDPGPARGTPLGTPLIDGLLGTDSVGRGLLGLTSSGLARALVAAAGPSLLAAVVASLLTPLTRWLPRAGQVFPGLAVDGLWWPAAVMIMFAGRATGSSWGLINPVVLGVTGLALVPTGLRLLQRVGSRGPGTVPAVAGVWLLLAPAALLANLVAAFAGFDQPTGPSLGQQLAASAGSLGRSVWPAVIPAVAVTALILACYQLGAQLLSLAWHRANRAQNGDQPWELSMRATHDVRPWYDDAGSWTPDEGEGPMASNTGMVTASTIDTGTIGTGTIGTGTIEDESADDEPEDDRTATAKVGAPHTADEDQALDEDQVDDEADAGDPHDGEPTPGGPPLLSPNFSLQPGLPPPELHATMQVPVVRVKIADNPEGGKPRHQAP
jgi:ABC-type dipeptide/oligopeptide/nickel transport system permease subunit